MKVANTSRKVLKILEVLEKYFPNPPVPLNYKDPFTFLCAVVLSAQTTDKQVNIVTAELFKVADTPQKMSSMKPEEIASIIASVGLAPKKALYLAQLSKKIVDEFEGKVPETLSNLESLPVSVLFFRFG
jgi:endonuclease III